MRPRTLPRLLSLPCLLALFFLLSASAGAAPPAAPSAEREEGFAPRAVPAMRDYGPDVHWFGFYNPATGAAVEGSTWTFDHAAADPLEGWTAEDRTACDFTAFRWIDPS